MERASSDRQVSIERIDCPATRKIEEQRPSFSSCVLFPSFSLGTSSSSYFSFSSLSSFSAYKGQHLKETKKESLLLFTFFFCFKLLF
jgi:hypothetical protein